VLECSVKQIRAHEVGMTRRLIDGLRAIDGVTVYGGLDAERQTATVSFNIGVMAPSEVGLLLDERYSIMCRVGLHCAPAAHRTMGTFPGGTVRFALGAFNTPEEVEEGVEAVRELACEAQ
jgi:selenocysteine lyase/cysteine desulfurase